MEQLKKIVVVEQVEEADNTVEVACKKRVPLPRPRTPVAAWCTVAASVVLAVVGLMFLKPPSADHRQLQRQINQIQDLYDAPIPRPLTLERHIQPEANPFASAEFQQEFEALLVKYDTQFQLQIESIQSLDIEPIQSPAGQDNSGHNGTHAQQ